MTHRPRQRSSSEVGSSGCGSSAPPSETSDPGSEIDSGVVANQQVHRHHISAKVVIEEMNGSGGGGFYGGSGSNATDSDVHSSSATSMTNEDSLSDSGILMECERGQVESFFSGLGTEVSLEWDLETV